MNQLGILHPDLLARLQPTHYASTVTIQRAVVTQDSYGEESAGWSDLAGHISLRCRIAPQQQFSREQRNQAQIYAVHVWDIALAGYYPTITEEMRAVVDGVSYEIELIQHDGNHQMTHLQVRIVT